MCVTRTTEQESPVHRSIQQCQGGLQMQPLLYKRELCKLVKDE